VRLELIEGGEIDGHVRSNAHQLKRARVSES
jgi:hypothetical protein